MRTRSALISAAVWALAACAAAKGPQAPCALRLYLPRGVVTEKDKLSLGDVAVVYGDDAAAGKASDIAMGRAPWPGEKLTITRATIAGRLASFGIDADTVRFSGAPRVVVERKTKVVSAEQIVGLADGLIRKQRLDEVEDAELERPKGVKPIVLAESAKVAFEVALAPDSTADRVIVEVAAVRGKKELAKARVIYKRMYEQKEAVAIAEIQPGEAITKENAKIETVKTPRRPREAFHNPYGMRARYRVRAGTKITASHLERRPGVGGSPGAPPVQVRRNENVIIRVRGSGFTVTALGVALEDGVPGKSIRVRNTDTQRIITGKIAPDGAVEPIMR